LLRHWLLTAICLKIDESNYYWTETWRGASR